MPLSSSRNLTAGDVLDEMVDGRVHNIHQGGGPNAEQQHHEGENGQDHECVISVDKALGDCVRLSQLLKLSGVVLRGPNFQLP